MARSRLAANMALAFICVWAGCVQNERGLSPEARVAIDKALVALRTMDAAAESSIPEALREYRARLIEAKAEVGQALVQLPEGEVKEEIRAALEVYVDREKVLEHVWDPPLLISPGGRGYDPHPTFALSNRTEEVKAFIERLTRIHGVSLYEDRHGIYRNDEQYGLVRFDTYNTLDALRRSGHSHIERASALLGG